MIHCRRIGRWSRIHECEQVVSGGSETLANNEGQLPRFTAKWNRNRCNGNCGQRRLSRVRWQWAQRIDVVIERFGTDFTDADQLFFDQIIEAALADGSSQEAAAVNPEGKFALLFSGLLETLFIERMEQNEDIFARFMNERDFQGLVSEWISRQVYERLSTVPR